MDPETRDILCERRVHFEESFPRFYSSTLSSSYFIEESDNDNSDLEDVHPQPTQRHQPVEV